MTNIELAEDELKTWIRQHAVSSDAGPVLSVAQTYAAIAQAEAAERQAAALERIVAVLETLVSTAGNLKVERP